MRYCLSFILGLFLICTFGSLIAGQSGTDKNSSSQSDEIIYNTKQVTKKAVVTSKPRPEYTFRARENRVEGTVIIRAIFRASGKVTNIHVVSGLPDGLTDQAIDAAHHIKFKPAEKDGVPVSTYAQLEYYFRL